MTKVFVGVAFSVGSVLAEPLAEDKVRDGLEKAVGFFRDRVAVHGGHVWPYSGDLKCREGEGKTGLQTAWAQPPGTPTVGLALLEAWQLSGSENKQTAVFQS